MIKPKDFYNSLIDLNINFFTGVPDSLLKEFCACISNKVPAENHIIAANEGGAIGLGIGHYLGSGKVPFIYLQNSGLGNIINPLLSLSSNQVYGIPMLIMIGWRGQPNIKDEPQHVHQGKVMIEMFESMNFPYFVMDKDQSIAIDQMQEALKIAINKKTPIFLVTEKDTFEKVNLEKSKNTIGISREEAINEITKKLSENHLIVSTTGMPSRELFEYREFCKDGHHKDFLTVGGMGHASQIALGLAKTRLDKEVICLDGDGAAIMHLGSFAIIGQSKCNNLIHIVLNNGVHDSVGGQPTVGMDINFCSIALSCGYQSATKIEDLKKIDQIFNKFFKEKGPHFLEVIVRPGNRSNLGRPTSTPEENKIAIMEHLGSINSNELP